jgi:hypothetical protein
VAALALDVPPQTIARVTRRASRAEPERAVAKVGLKDRLEHDLRRRLRDPIPNRWDAKLALTTRCLRDRDPPDRQRPVGALSQLCFEH